MEIGFASLRGSLRNRIGSVADPAKYQYVYWIHGARIWDRLCLLGAVGGTKSQWGADMVTLIRLPFVLLILMYQSIVLALGQIWSNKVRSTLTTIGIIIGIASVTAVVAVLTGLRSNVLSEFESFGTNKIFIFPDWRGARRANIPWQRIMFRPEHFEGLVEHCPSVGNLTRMNGFYGNSSVSFAGHIE